MDFQDGRLDRDSGDASRISIVIRVTEFVTDMNNS